MIEFVYFAIAVLWFIGASGFIVYRHETAKWPDTMFDSWVVVAVGVVIIGAVGAMFWPVIATVAALIIVFRLAVRALISRSTHAD